MVRPLESSANSRLVRIGMLHVYGVYHFLAGAPPSDRLTLAVAEWHATTFVNTQREVTDRTNERTQAQRNWIHKSLWSSNNR